MHPHSKRVIFSALVFAALPYVSLLATALAFALYAPFSGSSSWLLMLPQLVGLILPASLPIVWTLIWRRTIAWTPGRTDARCPECGSEYTLEQLLAAGVSQVEPDATLTN